MAAISVRDLDDDVASRLKIQAARNGRSMEAEVRAIVTAAVTGPDGQRSNLVQEIGRRFAAFGDVDLDLPDRAELPRVADLP